MVCPLVYVLYGVHTYSVLYNFSLLVVCVFRHGFGRSRVMSAVTLRGFIGTLYVVSLVCYISEDSQPRISDSARKHPFMRGRHRRPRLGCDSSSAGRPGRGSVTLPYVCYHHGPCSYSEPLYTGCRVPLQLGVSDAPILRLYDPLPGYGSPRARAAAQAA